MKTLRCLPALFAILMAMTRVAPAAAEAAIAVDSFETYAPATGGSLIGNDGGEGWIGPWLPGAGNVASVVDTSANPLVFTPGGGSTMSGGERAVAVTATGNFVTAARALPQPMPDVFYAAYLLRTTAGVWDGNNTFSIHFSDNESSTASLNFGIRASPTGDSAVNHFLVRTGTGNPGGAAGGHVQMGTTYYLVARISKLDANGDPSGTYDRMELWVNPAVDSMATAPDGHARMQLNGTGLSSITHALVRAAALQPADLVQFDELTVLPEWPLSSIFANIRPLNGASFVDPAAGLSFDIQSDDPVSRDSIRVILNGADVTADLAITGEPSSWSVAYAGLEAGVFYNVRIEAATSEGPVFHLFAFDTFDESFLAVEAEDFNFGGGQFIDDPVLCNDFGGSAGCYFDTVGVPGIDEFKSGTSIVSADRLYRWGSIFATAREELVDTDWSTDVLRARFASAPPGGSGEIKDFVVTTLGAGDWLNYTRTFSEGHYQIYLRVQSSAAQQVSLSRVSSADATEQTAVAVGLFQVPATGGAYSFVPLTDTEGRPLALRLAGVETLRLTALSASNNMQWNYLLFAPATAEARPAYVSSVSPADAAVNVAVTSEIKADIIHADTGVQAGTVRLLLDGTDVTSAAVVASVAGASSVTYQPSVLLPGAHTVALSFTDTAGAMVSKEWSFTVVNLPVLSAAWAAPVGSGTGSGFNVRSAQSFSTVPAAGMGRDLSHAENLLAGQVTVDHEGTETVDVVNYKERSDIGDQGAYTSGSGFPDRVARDAGLVSSDNHENFAVEITFFLELEPGLARLGVNANDGFSLRAGRAGAGLEAFPLVIAQYNGEGGATAALPQYPCEFIVTQAGVYAFRLVWVEYVGSSSVELHVKDGEGISYLLNDELAPLKAYLARTAEPPPSEGARLVIERSGSGDVTIRWDSPGKLQSAGSLPGPWSDVEPGPNPYTVTPGATRFYRVED